MIEAMPSSNVLQQFTRKNRSFTGMKKQTRHQYFFSNGDRDIEFTSMPRKSVARLTDYPDMTLDVYRGLKTTTQQQQSMLFPNYEFRIQNFEFRILNSEFSTLGIPSITCKHQIVFKIYGKTTGT